jgi:hypothetical protein
LVPVAALAAAEVKDAGPVLEVIDSSRVHLSAVRLSEADGVVTLRGRASRPIASRGFIPGAVRVSLHDASGNRLATSTVRPMRPNSHARYGKFFVQLATPDPMPEGTRVRVAAVPVPSR